MESMLHSNNSATFSLCSSGLNRVKGMKENIMMKLVPLSGCRHPCRVISQIGRERESSRMIDFTRVHDLVQLGEPGTSAAGRIKAETACGEHPGASCFIASLVGM